MSILAYIIVGIIAGFLAKSIIRGEGPGGLVGDLIIGVVGAWIGGWVYNYFGHVGATGVNIPSIICALIGALVLLAIMRLFTGKRV